MHSIQMSFQCSIYRIFYFQDLQKMLRVSFTFLHIILHMLKQKALI